MKKFTPKILLMTTLMILASCGAKKESPMIYFSNASPDPIFNVHCKWANGSAMSLSGLFPGESRSQSFYIKKNRDFFGLITISWLNKMGDQISRELFFREKHMPGINEEGNFNYVQFYLDQQGLDIVSSDEVDLGNKIRRMDDLMVSYRNEYSKTHVIPIDALVIVDRPKNNETPLWLSSGSNN